MASFFIDHNLSPRLAELLRQHGQDVVTAREAGLQAVHDGCILIACARTRRIVVTQDHDDFWELHQSWQLWVRAWGAVAGAAPLLPLADMDPFPIRHAGIAVVPQVAGEQRPRLAEALLELVLSTNAVENDFYRLDLQKGWQHRPYVLQLPGPPHGSQTA